MNPCTHGGASPCMHLTSLLLSCLPSIALAHPSVIRYVSDASHVTVRDSVLTKLYYMPDL